MPGLPGAPRVRPDLAHRDAERLGETARGIHIDRQTARQNSPEDRETEGQWHRDGGREEQRNRATDRGREKARRTNKNENAEAEVRQAGPERN